MNQAPLRKKNSDQSSGSKTDFIASGLLTPEATAALLGLDVRTLNNWRYRGVGPVFIRLGGKIRYSMLDLNTYVCESRRQITGQAHLRLAS